MGTKTQPNFRAHNEVVFFDGVYLCSSLSFMGKVTNYTKLTVAQLVYKLSTVHEIRSFITMIRPQMNPIHILIAYHLKINF